MLNHNFQVGLSGQWMKAGASAITTGIKISQPNATRFLLPRPVSCTSVGTARVASSSITTANPINTPLPMATLRQNFQQNGRGGGSVLSRQRIEIHQQFASSHPRWLSFSKNKNRQKRQQQKLQQQQEEYQGYQKAARRTAIVTALVVPITFVGWGMTDWIIGNQQLDKNETLRKEFLNSTGDERQLQYMPTKFHCVVRKVGEGMNHCLTGVRIGDVVEVLEEGVGPEQNYNLCRLPPRPGQRNDDNSMTNVDVYGWFPTRGLQKLEDYHAMVNNTTTTNVETQNEG